MTYRRDPHAPLLHALTASAARFGLAFQVSALSATPWASATFCGERLTLVLCVAGGGDAAWRAALPEEELPVRGRIVADLVVRPSATLTLDILLLEA